MSTRGSIQFAAIGSYRWRTEFAWHLYHECRDGTHHLELTAFGCRLVNVTLGYRAYRCLTGRPMPYNDADWAAVRSDAFMRLQTMRKELEAMR